jgi:hypothetical protein
LTLSCLSCSCRRLFHVHEIVNVEIIHEILELLSVDIKILLQQLVKPLRMTLRRLNLFLYDFMGLFRNFDLWLNEGLLRHEFVFSP